MESQIFPLLTLADVDGLSYKGFITIKVDFLYFRISIYKNKNTISWSLFFQGQELQFEIQLENSKSLNNAKLHGSPELKRLLFGHEKALKQVTKKKTFLYIFERIFDLH